MRICLLFPWTANLIATLAFVGACSATGDPSPDMTDSNKLIQPSTWEDSSTAGTLFREKNGRLDTVCSGFFYTPRIFVTALHCQGQFVIAEGEPPRDDLIVKHIGSYTQCDLGSQGRKVFAWSTPDTWSARVERDPRNGYLSANLRFNDVLALVLTASETCPHGLVSTPIERNSVRPNEQRTALVLGHQGPAPVNYIRAALSRVTAENIVDVLAHPSARGAPRADELTHLLWFKPEFPYGVEVKDSGSPVLDADTKRVLAIARRFGSVNRLDTDTVSSWLSNLARSYP